MTHSFVYLLAVVGLAFPTALFAQTSTESQRRSGAELYGVCAACHMRGGEGLPGVFPSLIGNARTVGRAEQPIAIVLRGVHGTTRPDGGEYSAPMMGWADLFSDEDVARVLTYIRSSWGNEASAVSAAEVARVRMATAKLTGPMSPATLKTLYP